MRSLTASFITLLLIIALQNTDSQVITLEEDTLFSNTTWNADTIKIEGDITVAEGARLTISAGTYVEFQGYYGIHVYGYLTAAGTLQDTVTFTINDNTGFTDYSVPDGSWYGILFLGTSSHNDTSRLTWSHISYIKKYLGSDTKSGGIYITSTHKILIDHCIIENNFARNDGPAIYDIADLVSYLEVRNCILRDNFSNAGEGGGICSVSRGLSYLHHNKIYLNEADDGGGIYVRNRAIIENNIIANNASDGAGGGIACHSQTSDIKITGNVICNNTARSSGGGIYVSDCNPLIINNTICNNDLIDDYKQGGGIYINTTSPEIVNNVIWGNEDQQIGFFPSDPDKTKPVIRHNVLQHGKDSLKWPFNGTYEENFTSNPSFVGPTPAKGEYPNAESADWSLQPWSICINNGTTENIPALPHTDVYGDPRIMNGQVDIGATEKHIRRIDVCGDLPADTVLTGDTIMISCDVFVPDTVTVRIPPGARVIFDGHHTFEVKGRLLAEGTPSDTIYFFASDTSGFTSMVPDSGGWDGLRLQSDSTVLSYCKFRDAKSQFSGGAIDVEFGSRVKINNCLFEHNRGYDGGAIYCYMSTLTLDHCLFRHNVAAHAYGRGGALLTNNTDLTMTHCTVVHNTSAGGGAINLVSADPDIRNCIVAYNHPCGIFHEATIPRIINCVLSNNDGSAIELPEGGTGGIILNNLIANNEQGISMDNFQDAWVSNNTIVNNSTSGIKGNDSYVILVNNIFHGNGTSSLEISSSIYKIHHCLINGGIEQQFFDNGNIEAYENILDEDPGFTNPISNVGPAYPIGDADFSINALSPCYNAGIQTLDPDSLYSINDIAGNARIHKGEIDLGAYEHPGSTPIFTMQPSGGTYCEGSSLEMNVTASDTVLYQWMKDGLELAGETGNRLKLDSIDFWNQAEYRCMISNNYGQTLSEPAYLFIRELPEFISAPSDVWATGEETVILNTLVKGTNPSLQWYRDGIAIPGEQSLQIRLENPDSTKEGIYQCVISNQCGADTTNPASVFLAPQICMVTVSEITGDNLVVWEKETKAPILAYNIYRESVAAGIYDLLATVPYDDLSVFVDTSADPTVQAYIYKVTALLATSENETDIDLCKPHKTIHLIVSTNPELNTTQLQWDRYYGFDYNTYTIYKSNTGSDFSMVSSLSSSLNSWTDPDPSTGDLYFRIAVQKPDPCFPEGGGKKSGAEQYQYSLSNMDNNKLKAGQLPPDTITINNNTIEEEVSAGVVVGKLFTEDGDSLDSHVYKFVPGEGSDDNASFTIVGDLLLASESFDYETKNQYSIRIRSTDEAGNYCEVTFLIMITDIDETTGLSAIHTNRISAYPNPFTQSTIIVFPNHEQQAYSMILRDLSGKVYRTVNDISTAEFELKRGDLKPGLYLIELRGPRIYQGKLMIK